MKIFGSIKELVAAVFRKDAFEITLRPNQSITYTAARDVQLPPQNADVVLVSASGNQTLTDKIIDGDLNTLQDISVESLKTVLADADKALVRDGSGMVTSAKIANVNVDAAAAIAYSKLSLANSIVNTDIASAAGIVDTKLATISAAGKVANSATTATSANTASAIVARDASGNFSAGTVTATSFSGPLTSSAISGATSVSYASTTAAAGSTVTPIADRPIIVLTTAPSTTINALANSAAGKQVVLINNGLGDLTINNNSGSPASSGIFTGTGTAFTFKSNAAITLTYSSDLSRWVLTGGAGGGSGEAVVTSVNGAASGYAVGTPVYFSSGSVSPADASAANTAEVVGLVQSEPSSGLYKVVTYGLITGVPASAFDTGSYPASFGEVVFLSPTTGKLTISEPNTIGDVSIPLGVYISTGAIYVAVKRGVVIGGTNARTELTLASASTTNIFNAQTPTLYQAGELTGWVKLGNSQKFYFRAPFAQNGAETNWNISPSYVGDTPPAGFSLQMSSAGVISITCPSFAGVGLVNYALNAPAVGATFPLEISALRITQDTIAAARLPVVVPGTSAGVVAAAGLPGNTTGSAIAAGYVGESATNTGNNSSVSTVTNLSSHALSAGIYLLIGQCWTTAATAGWRAVVSISTTNATIDTNYRLQATMSTATNPQSVTISRVIQTTGQPVYLVGSGPDGSINFGNYNFIYIRIA
jgi:hypothetical protein